LCKKVTRVRKRGDVTTFVASYFLRGFALSVLVVLTFLLAGFRDDGVLVFAAADLDCPLSCFFARAATTMIIHSHMLH